MKDSEFIELLNLYLDHEISAADAARLEAEVQSNPARRRRYQQYCRMQKACKMIAVDFQPSAESAPDDEKVLAFDTPRKRSVAYYAGTFAAVAACLAIAFVGGRRHVSPANPGTEVAKTTSVTIPVQSVESASNSAPRGLVQLTPRQGQTLVGESYLLSARTANESLLSNAAQPVHNPLAWIGDIRFSPVQPRVTSDDLHFAATLTSEGRPLGGRASNPQKPREVGEENLTFQITK